MKIELYALKEGKELKRENLEYWKSGYKCNKCSHVWIGKMEEIPFNCPCCNSARWNKEKEVKNGNKTSKKSKK